MCKSQDVILGGGPATDNHKAICGIFWILDNRAKEKNLPRKMRFVERSHPNR